MEDHDNEWVIDKFNSHRGSGTSALFEAIWRSGDRTWVPYDTVKHLHAFNEYLVALGISDARHLPEGNGTPPQDDPHIYLGCVTLRGDEAYKRRKVQFSSYRDISSLCGPTTLTFNTPFLYPFPLLAPSPSRSTLKPLVRKRSSCSRCTDPMPIHHDRLSRRNDGSLVFDHLGCQYSYPIAELQTALFFDSQLRENRVHATSTVIPGFYDGLAYRWNSLSGCQYKLATFEPITQVPAVTGPPIPRNDLIPARYALSSNSHDGSSLAGTDITADEQQSLLVIAAREKMKQDRYKALSIANRKAKQALLPEVRVTSKPIAGSSKRVRSRAKAVVGGTGSRTEEAGPSKVGTTGARYTAIGDDELLDYGSDIRDNDDIMADGEKGKQVAEGGKVNNGYEAAGSKVAGAM